MGQHPPGFITRSVSAGAGKGSDQEGFIHRLILMQCVSVCGGGTYRKGREQEHTFSTHSWRWGRAGGCPVVTPFPICVSTLFLFLHLKTV